ncbi:MAG: hypothetical protein ACOY99_12900 [Pseudomonadota bacterium]
MAHDVHYEVLGYDGRKWTLIEVAQSEKAAIANAKAARQGGRNRAVRVLRERKLGQDGEVQTIQVYYDGVKVAGGEGGGKMEDENERPANCWKLSDLYSYEGRRTLARLLARNLGQWQITPTELLHHPDYHTRLDSEGTSLQHAVQKVAIIQVQEMDISVQERMRQIYDIIGQAARRLTQAVKDGAVPPVTPETFDAVVRGLAKHEERGLLLMMGLAGYLSQVETLEAKLPIVLRLIEAAPPKWALRALDPLLAEIIANPTHMRQMVGEAGEGLDMIQALQGLRRGVSRAGHATVARLIAENTLVECRLTLERAAVHIVKSPGKLGDGSLLCELEHMRGAWNDFADDIKADTDFSWQMEEAFSRRSERTLSVQAVSQHLDDDDDPLVRLERLAHLAGFALGHASRRQLANFILLLLTSPPTQAQIAATEGKVMRRLRRLASLQGVLAASDFDEVQRGRMTSELDAIAARVMKESGLLGRLAAGTSERWEKALRLLQLIADGYFCVGLTLDMARAQTRDLMRGSKLLDNYLAGAKDQAEMTAKLQKLMALFTIAGIKDTNASA